MKKLLKNRLASFVTTLLIAFVFLASTSISPVSAASKKESLQYNQSDFLNYMAYDAVLLKKLENTMDKLEKLNSENSVKVYVSKSKKYINEQKRLLKKIKEYPTKNKDIEALKKVQTKIVEEFISIYSLTSKLVETQDKKVEKELDNKLKTFESKLEKWVTESQNISEKAMKKYQVKINQDIEYVIYDGDGPEISSQSFIYIVKKGDDLNKIAKTYKVSANDIKKWTKLKSSKLKVGQKIKIFVK